MSRKYPDRPKGRPPEKGEKNPYATGRPKDPPTEGRPPITDRTMRAAIRGSYGDVAVIARKLRTRADKVLLLLSTMRGGRWDWCRALLEREQAKTSSIAKKTVRHWMSQRDPDVAGTSLSAAKFHLEKIDRATYGDTKTVVLEGGKNPLRVEGKQEVSVDVLSKLPIEVRRQLLRELDAADAEEKEGDA